MARNPHGLMRRLTDYFGNECHYCGKTCNKRNEDPLRATKDHIVPRYFGGGNEFSNLVLACASCNSKRGNTLFECDCMICGPAIAKAMNNQANIDYVFAGLLDFNKPKVYFEKSRNKWVVKMGTKRPQFDSHSEAIEAAFTLPMHRSRTNEFR